MDAEEVQQGETAETQQGETAGIQQEGPLENSETAAHETNSEIENLPSPSPADDELEMEDAPQNDITM